MYQVTITNIQDPSRQWQAQFDTMEELNTWLDKQKLKEGRRPSRTIQEQVGLEDGTTELVDTVLPDEATYVIEDLSQNAEYMTQQAISNRRKEYPSSEEFMNVFFDKGLNSPEMDALRAKRTQIKNSYPK